jgi:hypothetical protein
LILTLVTVAPLAWRIGMTAPVIERTGAVSHCAPVQAESQPVSRDGKMPLVSDRTSKPLSHSNSRAIGFWMSVEGRAPNQPVRVLVSYEALSELDPTSVRDLHGALENFDRFRLQVETAASRKFDRHGFDGQKYEGMPAIRLTTDDLI